MMSTSECNSLAAPDVLQLNMDIISKELNDLIITADGDFGITEQFSMRTVRTIANSFAAAPEQAKSYEMPTYIDAFYGRQQFRGPQGIPNLELRPNNYRMWQQPVSFIPPQYSDKNSSFTNFDNINSNQVLNRSILSSTQDSFSNSSATPTYEFHYLRPRGDKDRRFSNSVSSLNCQGAFRKINKQYPKHIYQKVQNSYANKNDIQFDLSTLPPVENDKDNTNVNRIFDLLHDLYLAIDEIPITSEEDSGSQFEETFASLCNKKSIMPSTLNVQNQVKQACRKLTIFTYEMQRILNANKVYDGEMHAECEFYLNQLQQYLTQLEIYKGIVMEHRNGKFLREEVNAHAERLSLLLEHTNRQIREVHMRILAADWFIGVKYRGDIHLTDTQSNPKAATKSRIGVINELLQMCNTAEAKSLNYNTTAETFTTDPTFKATKQLLFNKEAVNVKPQLIDNNNIFNICKPNQIKRSALNATTGSSQHARQPVFYIG